MKRILLLTVSLQFCLLILANPVGRKAAQQKASRFMRAGSEMQLVAQAEGEAPAYYVFNAKAAKGGFVVISGDDRTDEVLGYADNGSFDPENVPDNMRWWLDCYKEQIEMIRSGKASPVPAAIEKEPVAPLLTTLWNQTAPYNLQCPTYQGQRCVTGCVATAMAQLLKYWGSGQETPGVPGYSTNSYNLSVAALPSTTFNWDLMKDRYSSTETGNSAKEVAKLMRYCGQVVQMDYSPYGSGAGVYPSDFIQYFGFDRAAQSHDRSNYNSVEWEELIYNELSEMRPLYYDGSSMSVGHAFVCDGYDGAGYYHINWGWGGSSNGYFKLSVMNPEDKGTGGGTSEDGYTMSQSIITGLIPDKGNETVCQLTVFSLSTDKQTYTRTSTNRDFTLQITGSYYNQSSESAIFEVGYALYKDDELKKTISGGSTAELGVGWGYSAFNSTITLGKYYSDGKYRLKSVCRKSGTLDWVENVGSGLHYIELELTGNTLTAEIVNSDIIDLHVNDFHLEGIMRPGEGITVRANITNNGTAFVVPLAVMVDNQLAAQVGLMVDPGKTDDVELHFTAPSAGEHSLDLVVDDPAAPITLQSSVFTIDERKDMNITAERPDPVGINPIDESVPGTTLHMRMAVTNNESEDFEDVLTAWLYKYHPDTGYYMSEYSHRQLVFIPARRTLDVDFVFENLEDGSTYLIVVYDPMDREIAQSWGYMMDASAVTGIESITTSPAGKGSRTNDAVFDLSGRKVSSPKPGLYIINGKKVLIK